MQGRRRVLTMAAVAAFVGVMAIQSGTASADPGYHWPEIDPQVPASLTDSGQIAEAIERIMRAGGVELIKKVQRTCGVQPVSGRIKMNTTACIHQHARSLSEARQCRSSFEECERQRLAAEARVRELESAVPRRRDHGRGDREERSDGASDAGGGLPQFVFNPNEPSPCPPGYWLYDDPEEGTTECKLPKWVTNQCNNPVRTNREGRIVYICEGGSEPAPNHTPLPLPPPILPPEPLPATDDGSWLSNNYGWLIAGGVVVVGGIALLAANDWKFLDVRTVPVDP